MSDLVSIQIRKPIFEKLQRLAILTGDTSSAIERLIAHWEKPAPAGASMTSKSKEASQFWHSRTGDVLPVGDRLEGSDLGKIHEAVIERGGIRYNGRLYDSPSAAARAVKQSRGLKGSAANTDGRKFWRIKDPKTHRYVAIKHLSPANRRTVEEMFAELDKL